MLAALFDLRSARQIDKFTPRVSASADARSANPRVKFTNRGFVLAPLYPQIYAPNLRAEFYFNSLSICNLRARFAAARATPLYTAARHNAFFASLRTHLRLFPARPAFKFCRFAHSIRSGYERLCAQTPNFRALFTRHCARILSKFYVEFQACLTYIRAAVINASF